MGSVVGCGRGRANRSNQRVESVSVCINRKQPGGEESSKRNQRSESVTYFRHNSIEKGVLLVRTIVPIGPSMILQINEMSSVIVHIQLYVFPRSLRVYRM